MKRHLHLKRFKRYFVTAGIALFLAVLSTIAFFVPPRGWLSAYAIPEIGEGEVRLHFLSVGQGDCEIVEFSDGSVYMIDSGAGKFNEENHLIRYLKSLKAKEINMILTHADSDHYGGFSELIDIFEVDRFYLPVVSSEDKNYTRLLNTIEKEGCAIETLTRYSSIDCADGYFVCLSPFAEGETDHNNSSMVLYLSAGGIRAVFSGDIEASRERRLVREYRADESIFHTEDKVVELEDVDFLKVSHHGSAESSSAEWLNLLSPRACFLECGEGNSYHFPRSEAIERMKDIDHDCEIYRTDELGDVIVTVKDGNDRVEVRKEL